MKQVCYRVLMQLCGQYGHPALAVKVSILDRSDVLGVGLQNLLNAPLLFLCTRASSLVHAQQTLKKRGIAHSLNITKNKDYHGDPFDIV